MNKVKGLFQKKATVVPNIPPTQAPTPIPSPAPHVPIKRVIMTVKLDPEDKTNYSMNNNSNNFNNNMYPTPEEVLTWFEENGFSAIEFHGYTDPTIQHVGNYKYKITFTPPPNETEEDIEFNAEMIADFDDDGNYPIEKGSKSFLVFGTVTNINYEYE